MKKRTLIRDLRRAVVKVLYDHDKIFHFDEDPSEIITTGDGKHRRTFTKLEADVLRPIIMVLHHEEMFNYAMWLESRRRRNP